MSKLYLLCGIPGSGKSTWAKQKLDEGLFSEIYSSDEYRERYLNDINDQEHNELIFKLLQADIINALAKDKDVCYDATNLSRRNRIRFLSKLSSTVEKIVVVFNTSLEDAINNNNNRDRNVPTSVIRRFAFQAEYPKIEEGYDKIITVNFKEKS